MGEYIAAAAILSIGTHKVALAQQDRIDLVAFTTDHFPVSYTHLTLPTKA